MKVAAGKVEGFVKAPPAAIRAFLLYGPDSGLISAHGRTLARQIVCDNDADPFNAVRLAPEDVRKDPARLGDELAATTLMGGQRVVTCHGFGERERGTVLAALEVAAGGENRLIVLSGDLKPASKLRKAFEGTAACAAIPCYSDETRSLVQVIRETLAGAGMEADRDALALLSTSLGADRSLSLRELEKLILYKGRPGPVREADVAAIIADAAPLNLDTYLYAVTAGDLAGADAALQRLLDDGQAPIRVHNALTQHLAKFVEVLGAATASGSGVAAAAQALRPPLFWKVRETFIRQAGRIRPARLSAALRAAQGGGIDLRVSALPADLVLSRLTLRLCQLLR